MKLEDLFQKTEFQIAGVAPNVNLLRHTQQERLCETRTFVGPAREREFGRSSDLRQPNLP
jgi:hypothetical protein